MEENKDKVDQTPDESEAATRNPEAELEDLTDKWKRALAEAENARKRAEMARLEGRDHGVVLAIETLGPAYDDICLAIESLRAQADAEAPRMAAHLEGLNKTKNAFETGLKALGVRLIQPKNTPFDPAMHQALQVEETDETKPGEVLVLHRPGFARGQRLIRPAHVTVSASPSAPEKSKRKNKTD